MSVFKPGHARLADLTPLMGLVDLTPLMGLTPLRAMLSMLPDGTTALFTPNQITQVQGLNFKANSRLCLVLLRNSKVDDVGALFQTQVQVQLSVGVSPEWAVNNLLLEVTLEHTTTLQNQPYSFPEKSMISLLAQLGFEAMV